MLKTAHKSLVGLAALILAVIIAAIVVVPQTTVGVIKVLYNFLTEDLAWLFLLMGVAYSAIAFVCFFTKYGDIRLGGRDAKPMFNTFMWNAMNICNALAAGVLIFGLCEWMFYVKTPPFGLEPGSTEAYEMASAYGMFHWGFSAWAFYLVPALAMGYLFWNKKCASLRISDLSVGILGGDSLWKRVARFLLDGAIVFGYFAAMMTTVGIGTPVMGELASHLLGIPNTFELKLGVILVFCLFFTLSASRSIARGMGRISNFNVALGLAFFAFVLISGDTAFILDNSVMAIGTNIREFLRMSFNSDAVAHTGFVQTWTIFYWAWYVAICYMCALWIARTSYGRTFREIAVANCIWAPLACWLTFCILGNYGMGQELFHGLKVSDAVGEIGTNGAALMVIQTLPLPKLAVFVFLILIFFNLATSATGNGIALSLYTSKGIAREDEADPSFKAFWCMLFLVLPVGILLLERAIPGLNVLSTIQSMITVSSIPMFFVLIALFAAFLKAFRTDVRSGEILGSVSVHRTARWEEAVAEAREDR